MMHKSILAVGRREAKTKQDLEADHRRDKTCYFRKLRRHNSGKVVSGFRGK